MKVVARAVAVVSVMLLSCEAVQFLSAPASDAGAADAGALLESSTDSSGDAAPPCARASCPDGGCAPIVLFEGLLDPADIVVEPTPCGTGTMVFATVGCTDDGGLGELFIADKDGGGRKLMTTEGCVFDLAASERDVVWAAYTSVTSATWDGGGVANIAGGGGNMYLVATWLGTAYWAGPWASGIGVRRIGEPVCTDECTYLDTGNDVFGLAAGAMGVAYGKQDRAISSGGGVAARLLADGGSEPLATGQYYPDLFVATDRHVFWSSFGIHRAPVGNGGTLIIDERPNGIAAFGDAIFWTTDSEVRTSDVDGKNVRIIARGRAKPTRIAVDDTALYWIEASSGSGVADGRVVKMVRQ